MGSRGRSKRKVRVPEDVAVLGVDDDAYVCDCAPVPLSSVRHDLEGMAYAGAALLERLMRGGKPPVRVLRVQPLGVVTRASTDMRAVQDVKVAIALRYLSERFPDPQLSVADVVEACGLSRRQLERSFRRETGSTVHGELTRVRIQHALQRLVETQDKVGEVGRQVGFARPARFFRTFRRLMGTTPKRYRVLQRRPLSRRKAGRLRGSARWS